MVKVPAPNILHDDDGVSLLHPVHGKHLHHIPVAEKARKHLEMLTSYNNDFSRPIISWCTHLTLQGLLPPCCRLRLHHLHSQHGEVKLKFAIICSEKGVY